MNRAMLEQLLAQAEEHIALGQHHIARQRELVAKLERAGSETTDARRLLANFETAQEMHLAHRDRVLNALAQHC